MKMYWHKNRENMRSSDIVPSHSMLHQTQLGSCGPCKTYTWIRAQGGNAVNQQRFQQKHKTKLVDDREEEGDTQAHPPFFFSFLNIHAFVVHFISALYFVLNSSLPSCSPSSSFFLFCFVFFLSFLPPPEAICLWEEASSTMADITHPPMEQLQDLEYCIDSNPPWGTIFNIS